MVLTMGAAACDSVEPGDYVVYRVASTSEKLSDGCYWQYMGADANVRNDTSTLQSSSTFVLYRGVETDHYLDTGDVTLEGELKGDTDLGEEYEFEGKTVDVEWDDPNGAGAKRTTTTVTEVEMTVDGELAFGEVKIKTSWSCNGQGCGEVPPSCTQTIEFVGTEVEDVNLEHDVPGGIGVSGTTPPDDDGSTSSSSSVGVGGAGGAGVGGAGGAGGGGTCDSCADVVNGAVSTADNLCSASQTYFDDLMYCACELSCYAECGETMCIDPSVVDSNCQNCVFANCSTEINTCVADTGEGA
jgi:hypothetical protein